MASDSASKRQTWELRHINPPYAFSTDIKQTRTINKNVFFNSLNAYSV